MQFILSAKLINLISKTDRDIENWLVTLQLIYKHLNIIGMKTIYECSQSKSVKWITAIFILAMVLGVLTEMYYVSKGMNVTGAIIVSAVLNVVFLMWKRREDKEDEYSYQMNLLLYHACFFVILLL